MSLQQQHRAAADELMACVARGGEEVRKWEREVEERMEAMATQQAEVSRVGRDGGKRVWKEGMEGWREGGSV